MNGRMGAGLNNQRQEVTGVRCAAQPYTARIGAVVAFGDGQNEVHATRMAQAGERWKMLELHCGDNVLARIALAAARCQGSRQHSRHRLGFPNSGWRGRKDWRLGSRRARGPGRTGGNPALSKSRVFKDGTHNF